MTYPWNIHGFLFSTFPGNILKRGTGTLVGKRSVITAAHCLYIKEKTANGYKYTPAKETYFFSGLKGKESLYRAKVLKSHVHPKYLQNDSLYDYALVQIDNDIGTRTGYSSLVSPTYKDLDDQIVNVTGDRKSVV